MAGEIINVTASEMLEAQKELIASLQQENAQLRVQLIIFGKRLVALNGKKTDEESKPVDARTSPSPE